MKLKDLMVVIALIAILSTILTGCNNVGVKNRGGTMEVNLPPGQKLEMATWKDADLWYMTRPMRAGEQPETHVMKERSNIGVYEGTVNFKEFK